LKLLLSCIDPDDILNAIATDVWLAPLRTFQDALKSASLIDESDCHTGRLSDRLGAVENTNELVELLGRFRSTHEVVNLFEKGLSRMSAERRGRFEEVLHKFIVEERRKNRRRRSIHLAGDILARMATCKLSKHSFKLLEQDIDASDPKEVGIIDPLCYVNMAHGREEPFVAHVKRLIDDASWREGDLIVAAPYYEGVRNLAWHIDRHLRTRPTHLLAHDVGRAIAVYPQLIQQAHMLDLAESIKEEAIKSVKELGLGREWHVKVGRLMER
jgi:hypothetical protein